MKALRYLIPLGVFLLLCAFFAVGLMRDPREVPSPFIGKPAPAFTLQQLYGNVDNVDLFIGGSVEQKPDGHVLGSTFEAIIVETAATTITERGATRLDDQTIESSMELRKKEGYF